MGRNANVTSAPAITEFRLFVDCQPGLLAFLLASYSPASWSPLALAPHIDADLTTHSAASFQASAGFTLARGFIIPFEKLSRS